MIIVKIVGGLGNQMFQYAFAKNLSLKLNAELKLDISEYNKSQLRTFALIDIFDIFEKIVKEEDIDQLFKVNNIYEFFKFKIFYNDVKKHRNYIKEKTFLFDKNYLELKDNVYLDGYWQTEKYFTENAENIRKLFRFRNPLDKKNGAIADLIKSANSIGVHIRRGDYISNPVTNKYHGFCGIDYIEKAINYIVGKISNPHFFVFSDDVEWCRNNLKAKFPILFVENNHREESYKDMHLMSLCKHNIIANSSFSWWAAWLNANRNKIIIAPNKWFENNFTDTKDLIPENWIRI